MDQIAVFDLGSSKVAAMTVAFDESGEMKILASFETPNKGVKKGTIIDLEETQRAITECLAGLNDDLGDSPSSVWITVGGSNIDSQLVRGMQPIVPSSRPISRDDVMQVVNHSRRQVLPPDREEIQAIPQTFTIDGQNGIDRPVGLNGSRLEVSTLLVTAPRSILQNLERAFDTSGIKVNGYVLRPLAAGLAVLSDDQRKVGSLVVDLGAASTEMAVFSGGGVVSSASVPLGLAHVSSDLMKLLKTSPEEAEKLKLEFGCAIAALVPPDDSINVMQLGQIHGRPMQRRVLCEIIESRMREIAQFVYQQLERTGHFGVLPGGVVVTGGGAEMEGVRELFSDVLTGHNVTIGKLRGKTKVTSAKFASCYGAAKFLADNREELAPVELESGLAGKVKTIWSMLSGKDM
jgi:cell division protein FtsA